MSIDTTVKPAYQDVLLASNIIRAIEASTGKS
jgi:hypothetical protein